MADTIRVKIDLARVAANLTAAEGNTVTVDFVRSWLSENGFIPLDNGLWLCEDVSLDLLDKSEILGTAPAD